MAASTLLLKEVSSFPVRSNTIQNITNFTKDNQEMVKSKRTKRSSAERMTFIQGNVFDEFVEK